jgi:exodeoxyribonuclease VII large subunit
MNSISFADTELEVSDFVALVNQTFEYAYPVVAIRGELANFKVSKGKWIYFDLKDDMSVVRFFGTVYSLPGPVEDGMTLIVRGTPRLHPRYGFSVSVQSIRPTGQGSIRRSAELLRATLAAEGLFDIGRKRLIPYPPVRVGLITSTESAAYADFIKVLRTRWQGISIECIDVQVQGESAPQQIISAIETFNGLAVPPDVIVLIRGGGSADDLYAFSAEGVARAVGVSRVPTLVAIGHEVDTSLAELVADRRASTPSNAAELLVPDRADVLRQLVAERNLLCELTLQRIRIGRHATAQHIFMLQSSLEALIMTKRTHLIGVRQLLEALSPYTITRRGYAIVRRQAGGLVRSVHNVARGDIVDVELADGNFQATVQ